MTKIIIDTDPGIDDAMAILFAHLIPSIELLGLTTIFGNVSTDQSTENALRLVDMMGLDIPVAKGADKPMVKELKEFPDFVHGKNGFGDIALEETLRNPIEKTACDYLIDSVLKRPGEITIVAIGPLTNLALAIQKEPLIKKKVKEVVIMGGAIGINGNVNPAAEANMLSDPHAADLVLTSDWPVTLIGLDVSQQIIMTEKYLQEVHHQSSFAGGFILDISKFYLDFHRDSGLDGIYTHDPSTLAYLAEPDLFTIEKGGIRVVTEGIAIGQTIMNRNKHKYGETAWSDIPDVRVCMDVDHHAVLELYRKIFQES